MQRSGRQWLFSSPTLRAMVHSLVSELIPPSKSSFWSATSSTYSFLRSNSRLTLLLVSRALLTRERLVELATFELANRVLLMCRWPPATNRGSLPKWRTLPSRGPCSKKTTMLPTSTHRTRLLPKLHHVLHAHAVQRAFAQSLLRLRDPASGSGNYSQRRFAIESFSSHLP